MAVPEEPTRIDWAEDLENKLGGPKEEVASVRKLGNRKIVTEIHFDENTNKREKVVTEFALITKRVPKAVALRKKWKKFGEASRDPPGPQSATTVIADETPIQFITGREDVMGAEPTIGIGGAKDKLQVACRTCGGDHWTTQCQFRNHSDAEKAAIQEKLLGVKATSAAPDTISSDVRGDKYVPPNMRAGAIVSSSAMGQESLPSIRVSNLPTDVKEDDLRDIFNIFGRIKKVYLGRDKKTGEFKGFAFVTFFNFSEAEDAIAKVNGHKYFHMILSVDWANPSKG